MRLRNFIGSLLSYGECELCGTTWWRNPDTSWSVPIGHGTGCFRICRECWGELDKGQRLKIQSDWINDNENSQNYRPHRSALDALDCLSYKVVPYLCHMTREERAFWFDSQEPHIQEVLQGPNYQEKP